MPPTHRIVVASALAVAAIHVLAGDSPAFLLGTYTAPTQVCHQVAVPERDQWIRKCEEAVESLRLSRVNHTYGDIRADAEFVFAGGHTCEFRGFGGWNGVDRIHVRNEQTQCEVVLIYSSKSIHTVVTTYEQCRRHCGSRASLDGLVLGKR